MTKTRLAGLAIVAVFFLFAGLVGGILLDRSLYRVPTAAVPSDNESARLQLFQEAWTITRDEYVDRPATDPTRLVYGAIGGMIDSLGDTGHSRFLSPAELRAERNFERGSFEGVGIEVQEKDGQVVIVAPIDNSPAQRAGLKAGEIVLAVDGKPVTGLADAVHRILGPAGTQVTLTIQSTSGQKRDVPLTRAAIQIKAVTWKQIPGTTLAHVRVATFARGATRELRSALDEITRQPITGIVLDLRDNPGGLLDESINTASLFLKSGNVLLERSADGTIKPFPVRSQGKVVELPVTVLTSKGTASAAEIVSGALHDAGRAKLIGETTFGTGTVLNQFSLSDGSALLLATQEWLTPSGKTIWHQGLTPDIAVALPQNTRPLFPSAEADMTKDHVDKSGDAQLLQAISQLTGAK